ncbi:hypothetical protein CWO27_14590 [Vibrio sp. 10N.286.51.C3]|uniref:hypothetical protein n=1 Tax=unclassified Vibrio TaxID=2614977 RepID=UPI000D37DA2A|nr:MULTISPECIES: hypothetical protein [unclassified Vibrio]PTP13684.1 hypothetical protein CWO27_14590 [Vibrio sp. 10N.286.51.C3]TKE74068.1 hypothetical protein FCV45_01870 [Vibrio sp. F12]
MPMIEIGSYFSTENWLAELKWVAEAAVNSKNVDKVQSLQEELVRGMQESVTTAPLSLTFAVTGKPDLHDISHQLPSLVFDSSGTYIVGNVLGLIAVCKILGLKTFLFSSRLSVKEANRKSELRQRLAMEDVEVRVVFDDVQGLTSHDIIELFKKSSTFDSTLSLPHLSDGKRLMLNDQIPLKAFIEQLIKETKIDEYGGVNFDSKHVKVSEHYITTQYILFKLLVGAVAGVGTQEYSKMSKDVTLADGSKLSSTLSDSYVSNISVFLKAWLNPLKIEFANNRSGYHLSPQVWQALGLAIHQLVNRGTSANKLKAAGKILGELDYNKSASHWERCAVMELDSKGRVFKNASNSTRQFRSGLCTYFLQVIEGAS